MSVNSANHYQVLIVGGGPAGLSAALWCSELGLQAALLESAPELGGQLLWTYNSIKNYLGIEAENGKAMQQIFLRQLSEIHVDIKLDCEVVKINAAERFVALADGTCYTSDFLILATGVRRRQLVLPNEERFQERGIIRSGKREAKTVKGKRVCVVGGGDAALENALILAEFAESVILVHRRKDFRARQEFIEKVLQNQRITVRRESAITELKGEGKLEKVTLQDLATGKITELTVDILIFRIGVAPNTELFASQIELNRDGYCRIDSNCETNIRNVFAIGDAANPLAPTISSAIGMGATAAKVIASRISTNS